MRNAADWKPSKFVVYRDTLWRASRDPNEVYVGSRLVSDLTARFYAEAIPRFVFGHTCDLGCGKAPLAGLYGSRSERVTCIDWPSGSSPHSVSQA